MFFYLGQNCELLNKQRENLFTDLGWKTINDVYYKGYCLDYDIQHNIDKILGGDKPQGIYCVIKDNELFYPEMRPFPLYQQGEVLTNLRLENFAEVDYNRYQLPSITRTFNEVVNYVTEVLVENLSKFELNIWCTGGIDSMMLVAIAEYAKLPYTIHVAQFKDKFVDIKDWEGTVEEYQSPLLDFCRRSYWSYEFLSNFNDKMITTGFYGDEYFCRSIWQINTLANSINKTGIDIVKPSDYVYKHINKSRFAQLHGIDKSINLDNAKLVTVRSIGTGHAWHIDNTLTFCPIMDKRIVDSVWSLDITTLIDCAPDATIQKEIIRTTTPDVLLLVDDYKNAINGRKNFFANIEKVKLNYCKELIVG
jgi:hypothetical protein